MAEVRQQLGVLVRIVLFELVKSRNQLASRSHTRFLEIRIQLETALGRSLSHEFFQAFVVLLGCNTNHSQRIFTAQNLGNSVLNPPI